ncbi:hypothetical protein BHE74_00047872 [Ensete ventricosum]|nr:hypothetical protein GW17_00038691 [Ensete ventricosum]RWW46211.1 hypothetical protein BHE74_00047872 [Ensete ventricosum]
MHPLRFSNSGIEAKRGQQGGGVASHGQPPCRVGQAGYKGQLAAAKAKALCRGSRHMRDRPRAWLAPARAAPTGVGSAPSQGYHLQGRSLLQGQRPDKAAPPARGQ